MAAHYNLHSINQATALYGMSATHHGSYWMSVNHAMGDQALNS